MKRHTLTGLALLFVLAGCNQPPEVAITVLSGATIIDGTGAAPRQKAVIVIERRR